MLVYGASGHSKVILDCLLSNNLEVKGIFDDNPKIKNLLGHSVYGSYDSKYLSGEKLIIAIGDNLIRQKISLKINHKFGNVFHKSACISNFANIGLGTVVFQGAIIQNSTSIGNHCILNTNSSIDHDCIIDDFVHIAPNVTLCGGVSIGKNSMIGAGSVVIPNVKIGKNVLVGAGSVVLRNIPDNTKVFGNPAKVYV